MAAFQALQALAIDIMLPALGTISQDLELADPNRRQLIVGVFLVCAGLGSLVPGSLADRFGRRPVRWFGRRSAHDVGLNHDVVSTTNQYKMFDIVTANELDTSFSVELDGFDYSYPL